MRISEVAPLEDYRLSVLFDNGVLKIYDMGMLFDKYEVFTDLKRNHLFKLVQVDAGGQGISWNADIDLCMHELWKNGVEVS